MKNRHQLAEVAWQAILSNHVQFPENMAAYDMAEFAYELADAFIRVRDSVLKEEAKQADREAA